MSGPLATFTTNDVFFILLRKSLLMMCFISAVMAARRMSASESWASVERSTRLISISYVFDSSASLADLSVRPRLGQWTEKREEERKTHLSQCR